MKILNPSSSEVPSNPKPENFDVVILGGGTGSTVAAWTFAGEGKRGAVVDRKYIGGSCPNTACLPSKNIIHSAKIASYFRRGKEFGIMHEGFTIHMPGVRDRKRKMVSLDDFRVVHANLTGGNRVTTGRQVPYCLFTDPEPAHIGLGETEAQRQQIPYRLFKIPMEANLRARTVSETRGFIKALVG
jgi:pyruvate/2-oxoglutarate dehydrogenase complex dihydrolipoamide dehydrogenase (E3) component